MHGVCPIFPPCPGVPAYEVLEWNPVLAPAGIFDKATKATLVAALRKAMADPEGQRRVRNLSGEVFEYTTEAGVSAFLKAQQTQWARIVRERKIVAGCCYAKGQHRTGLGLPRPRI